MDHHVVRVAQAHGHEDRRGVDFGNGVGQCGCHLRRGRPIRWGQVLVVGELQPTMVRLSTSSAARSSSRRAATTSSPALNPPSASHSEGTSGYAGGAPARTVITVVSGSWPAGGRLPWPHRRSGARPPRCDGTPRGRARPTSVLRTPCNGLYGDVVHFIGDREMVAEPGHEQADDDRAGDAGQPTGHHRELDAGRGTATAPDSMSPRRGPPWTTAI